MEMSKKGEISGEFFGNPCSGIWHDFLIGFSGKN